MFLYYKQSRTAGLEVFGYSGILCDWISKGGVYAMGSEVNAATPDNVLVRLALMGIGRRNFYIYLEYGYEYLVRDLIVTYMSGLLVPSLTRREFEELAGRLESNLTAVLHFAKMAAPASLLKEH
jgi:hypothetical protein